jgi:uncharacterized protein YraI
MCAVGARGFAPGPGVLGACGAADAAAAAAAVVDGCWGSSRWLTVRHVVL